MNKYFAVNDHVRVKMSIRSSRVIYPGEIAAVTRMSICKRVALYDVTLADGTVASRVPGHALEVAV